MNHDLINCINYSSTIWVGLQYGYKGPTYSISKVLQLCQKYVDDVGLCVTVTPTTFVYTGGSEPGFSIGIINYPRYPKSWEELYDTSINLATKLKENLFQHRVTVCMTGPEPHHNKNFMIGNKDD